MNTLNTLIFENLMPQCSSVVCSVHFLYSNEIQMVSTEFACVMADSPSRNVTVVDIYDLAAVIGKDFERLIELFGSENFVSLLPKVISALELLESFASRNERENQEIDRLKCAVERLEAEKRERKEGVLKFQQELEAIEENYKAEIHHSLEMVRKLQDENKRLCQIIESKECSPVETFRSDDIEKILNLSCTVEQQRNRIKIIEKEFEEKTTETEKLLDDVDRLQRVNKELARRYKAVRSQGQTLVEEKTEMICALQNAEKCITELRAKLGETEKAQKDLEEIQSEVDNDHVPRFTLAELREVLQEKNHLKAKVMELEEELSQLRPPCNDDNESKSGTSSDEVLVYGPINKEPEEKIYPEKYSRKESGIRRFWKWSRRRFITKTANIGFDEKFCIEKECLVIFVVSTTGDGEPPDSAHRFFTCLKRLGDSNYNTFCGAPKALEKLLLQLHAKAFYPTGYCDEAVETATVAEPWICGLLELLLSKENLDSIDQTLPLADSSLNMENTEIASLGSTPERLNGIMTPRSNGRESQAIRCRMETDPNYRYDYYYDDDQRLRGEQSTVVDPTIAHSPSMPSRRPRFYTFEECQCRWAEPSVVGCEQLRNVIELKVPSLALIVPKLTSIVTHEDYTQLNFPTTTPETEYAGQASPRYMARLLKRTVLTAPTAKKSKVLLQFDLSGFHTPYKPGDAFSFICSNPQNEVNWLLYRMNLSVLADKRCTLKLLPEAERRGDKLPPYLPEVSSLRYLFTHCLDIRQSPSRILLRLFAEHCKTFGEKRRLMELCSSQGQQQYQRYIRRAGLSLMDVLHAFPSCLPPVDRLIELLPRLRPRPSPLVEEKRCNIVYTLVTVTAEEGRFYARNGLATGYFETMQIGDQIEMFLRQSNNFCLPPDVLNTPIVMIGPGTGVAPFISFMQHIKALSTEENLWCERWLFYGCQFESLDYIFREQLEDFHDSFLLTHLVVSFSKEEREDKTKYIQDSIRDNGFSLVRLLTEVNQSRVYVCGDVENMAKEVFQAFLDILQSHGEMSAEDAKKFMSDLITNERYILDYWL
ncbi:Methionine synthase reductase [Trichinella pseudospiralis]|uniref:Methionine synthase reductase n=1 Tax=Trichinella pseudospiralis TaxID=6337 RepID=A0A0V1EIG4_TRIPS|nr:Methionine synthase reductase [Trichinella pseudospiralis]